ncbi:MAG: HAD family phosphatase [Candidatus Omnitrophica bacterium]|nr:HAD family phosphatase [Candidatus Omnitrophota bacterium]
MVKAVLFDLGKVLFHFNFKPAFRRLARVAALTPEDIGDYFVDSGLEVLYDSGRIGSLDFYRRVKKTLGLSLNYPQFKKIWNEIFTPNLTVIRLVRRLKKKSRLVLISNTNAMHFEYLRSRYAVLGDFDKCILSYKEKVRKPDERIYRSAIRACKARPHEIFYIDDRSDLTKAAGAMGFQTFTYRNHPRGLVQKMKKLGLL